MAEGGGPTVGNFYFDVIFRDKTEGILQNIQKALNKIDKDITITISGKIGGDMKKIQQDINQKLSGIKAAVPVLLRNDASEQIRALVNVLKGMTVEINTVLKVPTKANLQSIQKSVKSAAAEVNVVLKNIDQSKIDAFNKRMSSRLKLEATVNANTARNSLQAALKSRKFKFDVVVDQMKVAKAVQAALTQAGLNSGAGITADQARAQRAMNQAAESQARINRQNAESQARIAALREKANAQIAVSEQKKRTAIEQTNAAQSRSLAATARATAAIQRNTAANQQNAASYMLINKNLMRSIPLSGSLFNMARNYIGVFGAVSALRGLYDIRAEFERQAVALKALMQSASQARQVMSELQAMALKSPFAVADIIGFAKQLSAYSISNNELVDTTKRLADLSAGLGVDMSRLILAYGQVKAATVLRGQELRQFTEAGIPMVRALADEFTKMEGKVVTAADVFDRISKKAVSFEMVKKVLDSMTSEGGRFYEHQAKMVETLYGKVERMGDAYKVMMNQFGESNDALLKAPIDAITKAMMDWRSTIRSIISLISAAGAWKILNAIKSASSSINGKYGLGAVEALAMQEKIQKFSSEFYESAGTNMSQRGFLNTLNDLKRLNSAELEHLGIMGKLTKQQTLYLFATRRLERGQVEQIALEQKWDLTMNKRLLSMSKMGRAALIAEMGIVKLGLAFKAFAMQLLPVAFITFLVDIIGQLQQARQEIEDFNNAVRDSAKEVADDLHNYLESHREAFDLILDPTIQQDDETLRKAWEDIKSKIEEMPNQEIAFAIVSDGADNLKQLTANAIKFQRAMENVEETIHGLNSGLEVTKDTIVWGLFGEGAKSDLKDYEDELKNARKAIDDINKALKHYNVDFSLNFSDVFSDSYKDGLAEAASKAGIKTDWIESIMKNVAFRVKDSFDEASSEVEKSLRKSLIPAFEELREKGISTPKEMTAAYVQMMPQIKDMMGATTRELSDLVDTVAFQMLSKSGYELDQAVLLGTKAANDLRNSVTREAQNMNVDINEIIENGNTELIAALFKAAIDNNDRISDVTRAQFNALRDYIQSHPAVFRVLMRVETQEDGEARKYLKGLTGAKNNFALTKMYGASTPEGNDTNQKAISKAKENRDNAIKNQEILNNQLNNLAAVGKKNNEQYKEVERQLENERINEKNARDLIRDIGGDENEGIKTPKSPKAKKTGGGSKRDTWLDDIKNRISEFKEAQSEIEKLRKMGMSQAEAIDKVMSMSWTYGLDKAKLGRGGAKKMVDALIPLVEEHGKGLKGAFKQANDKLLLDLQKMSHDEQLKQYEENAKKIGDEIRNRIETGVKNWKLYDTLFEATGDEAMSANVAFGGKKLFKNLEEQLIAIFNENTSGISFEDAVKMDETSLREVMTNGEAYIDLLKRIKEARESDYSDIMTEAAKAIEEQMTWEERIQKQRIINQKKLQEYVDRNGGYKKVFDDDALLEGYFAYQKALDGKVNEMKAQALEYSDLWEKIFGKLTYKSYDQVKAYKRMSREIVNSAEIIEKDKYGRAKTYISEYIDEEGVKQQVTLTAADLKKLKENFDNLDQELQKKNPFRRLIDLINEIRDKIRNGDKVPKELFAELADSASACADIVSGVASSLGNMFKALGKGGEQFEDMSKFFDSISNIAKGFVQGGYVGLAVAAVGEVASWVQRIAEAGDKALQERIDKQSAALKAWSNMYSDFEREISRRLGSIYADFSDFSSKFEKERKADQWWAMYGEDFGMAALNANNTDWEKFFSERTLNEALSKGDIYTRMFQDLVNQRDATLKQLDEEQSKKNSDEGAIEDYRNQISQLDDQIRHFAEDMAKSLYDIDVKNWAKELTDAVVSAWQNGENAAEAYKEKVKDIIADVTKNVISQKIMEMALAPVLDAVVGEMTAKNGMLDEESLVRFANELSVAGTGAVNTITGLLDKMKELGYDLSGTTDKAGTLGQGIKSITEDQANLLASYLNAMRADLSIVRLMWEQHAAGTSVVAQAQLTQLNAIAANTLRNAEAAERIETAFNSVITVGASGARIRV